MGKQLGPIQKIRYNCRKATFLIEKKQISRITLWEQVELKIHLAGCSICRIFEQQSILINGMVHELFDSAGLEEKKLQEAFKQQLQDRIDQHLDKK